MIRIGTLFWLVLVCATGFAMFGVKYQVQALEDELARTRRATAAEEHEIRVLDAEWAYLTRPETLEGMNRRFLALAPIGTKQLRTTPADIPLRALPETAVADAAPAQSAAPPPQDPAPPQSAPSALPEESEASRAAPQSAKPVPARAVAKLSAPRRPKSLDDLIAQITASR
jgi:hypothetical protein